MTFDLCQTSAMTMAVHVGFLDSCIICLIVTDIILNPGVSSVAYFPFGLNSLFFFIIDCRMALQMKAASDPFISVEKA